MERELLLLGLLRRQDMHGYRLIESIDGEFAVCTDMKKPTAYYLLDKMAQKGWVTRTDIQEGNRPTRQVYGLTPAGEESFQSMLRSTLASYTSTKFADDAALAFIDELPIAEVLPLLNTKRDSLVADLESIRMVPAHVGPVQFMIDHRRTHLEAELKWLDELVIKLTTPASNSER